MTETGPNGSQCNQNSEQWLAYELHDGMLQWVIAARMQVEAILRHLADSSGESLKDSLGDTQRYLATAIAEGRDLIAFLERYSDGEDVNVQSAIQEIIATLADERVRLQITRPWPRLPRSVGWNILRIVQQAVQNAIVHSQATHVTVVIDSVEPDALLVTVTDDGVGFDESAAKSGAKRGHFGLSSMRFRARLIAAHLSIRSSSSNGCILELQYRPGLQPRSE
ncbi:MAG: hypothetical protein KDB22_07695 [Planctomycetales bacterium]|nr:hypothetical protein [Planctomycetales bacterium]